jgi:transposase
MHKALTQMNLKLQHVVSDVTGETGMAIIRAILAGERDPVKLAHLRHDRCQHDEATIAKALCGQWREEPLFALAQAVALYDIYHQKIGECDRQSEAHLGTFAERMTVKCYCRWCGRGSGRATDRISMCAVRYIG